MKKKDVHKLSSAGKRRIRDAEKSYRRMWLEIKPFVKKRKVKEYSTRGQWTASSHER
jgi:hypothetical protein